jgi:hypothetical protein
MKTPRHIGIVIAALFALTGLVCTSQAFAANTALCSSSGTSCSEANTYAAGTLLKASSTNATIKGGIFGDVSCKASSVEGKSGAATGEPLPLELTAFSLSSCTHYAESCTVSTEHLPYNGSVAYRAAGDGKGDLTLKGSGGEVGWHVTCPGVGCTFSFEPTFSVQGGNPAQLADEQSMKFSGGFCPRVATFSATYTESSPQPLYVLPVQLATAAETILCDLSASPCPAGNVYPSGTKLSARLTSGATAQLAMGLSGEMTCKGSTLGGETTASSGRQAVPASLASFTLTNCTYNQGETCSTTAEGLPYSASFNYSQESLRGTMIANGLRFHVNCGGSINCTFEAKEGFYSLTNGSPAILSIEEDLSRTGSICPSSSIFTAKYEMTSPKPFYLGYNL